MPPAAKKTCKTPNCGKARYGSFALCFFHQREKIAAKSKKKPKPCKLPGCKKPRFGQCTFCYTHYFAGKREQLKKNKERLKARKLASKGYQEKSRKNLHAKCWKLMSELVRRQGADWRGYAKCYTCEATRPWNELHAGHYQHGKLDFDERNIRPQCEACNTYHGGRLDVYTLRLIQENGIEWVKELKIAADRHPGYRLEELKVIYDELQRKLSQHPFLS